VNWREKTVECLFGDICLTHSYYHCKCCGASQMPWDESLRLGKRRVTAGAEEAITLAGLLTSFGQAHAGQANRHPRFGIDGASRDRGRG
jgi:hypothetical protein